MSVIHALDGSISSLFITANIFGNKHRRYNEGPLYMREVGSIPYMRIQEINVIYVSPLTFTYVNIWQQCLFTWKNIWWGPFRLAPVLLF